MRTRATPHPPPSPLPAQAGTRRGRAATRTPWIPIPATPAPQQQISTVSMLFQQRQIIERADGTCFLMRSLALSLLLRRGSDSTPIKMGEG